MKNEISFESICEEILKNKKYKKIGIESHHGITRLEHTLRVSRHVYKWAKKLNLDYVSATRAALLHDFFINEEFGSNHGLIQGVVHPDIALANAKGEFEVNEIEENAIVAHMFPLSMVLPRYKEGWVLTAVDKCVAVYEYCTYKFHYSKFTEKLTWAVSLCGIFIFNLLTMSHK